LFPPRPRCFQRTHAVFPRCRPPISCEIGFILSCACLPFRVRHHLEPVRTILADFRTPSLRFLSPSRHRLIESTSRRASHLSPTFRPQRFSHSRRFTPRCALWACFIPLPRPGFTVQGVSPLPGRPDSSPCRPLLSLPTLTSNRVAPTVQLRPTRLQGVDPGSGPLRQTGCLALPATRSPLQFSAPSGFPSNTLATPSRRLRS
jgi:hypothetical protein